MATIQKGNNKFYIGENEETPIAEITFKPKNEQTIIADHTYVSDELRGEGIAGKLLEALIDYARKENKKIVPVCSYVKQKMERTEEYHDLIAK
ncbi:GNAT family N-acetyltransferase [Pseudogracilibacillus sp. SE30717A]|uniref:GNAT family N-acetyltransferase n=1 Tax=Pseudogracilibacillus sp. SE30717A TaxID=3098293 RepID=UPI00300DEAE5